MAEFSEQQEIFAQILVDLDLETEEIATIMAIVQESSQMQKMVDFIEKNQRANFQQLLNQATKVINQGQDEDLDNIPMMIGIITKEYGALPFLMTGEEYEEYLKDLSEDEECR